MICPHCGKNTRPGELCEYCKKPTEFVSRSNIRPGAIPGESKQIPNLESKAPTNYEKMQSPRLWIHTLVLAVVVILTAVITWMLCFRLSLSQVQTMEETKPSEYQDEQIPTEKTQKVYCAVLYYNKPQQEGVQENISEIRCGENIPELSDEEGYRFLGWNTAPDGKGTSFQPGEPFMIVLAEDLMLYGQWEQDTSTETKESWIPELWEIIPQETEATTVPEETVEETGVIREENGQKETTHPTKETMQADSVEGGEQ